MNQRLNAIKEGDVVEDGGEVTPKSNKKQRRTRNWASKKVFIIFHNPFNIFDIFNTILNV